MAARQPDEKLIRWIGFPDPPHRVAGSRGKAALFVGRILVLLLFLVAVALPVAVLGFSSQGPALLVDSALGLGLGSPAPDVAVTLGGCDYYRTTGRYGSSGWDCVYDLTGPDGVASAHAVELDGEDEAALHRGAGTVLGATGLYWPAGVLIGRWMDMMLALVMSALLLAFCYAMARMLPGGKALSRARDGTARTVDLLTRGGKVWFAFVDDDGTRHFQRATLAAAPLHLDGVLTTGVALISGDTATLLYPSLWPLKLPADRQKAILARAAEAFRAGLQRKLLPPQPGDPATLAGRIDRIEAELAANPDPAVLARLYDDAWRLAWDNDDQQIMTRVYDARDAIALRLGPEAAWAALDRSRKRFAKPET